MTALQAPDARLIPIDQIDEGERLRETDPARVRELAVSIEETGLSQPILVRPKGERFALVAGRHRMSAFVHLGREQIPAIVREMSDLDARLVEIDENLIRAELTPLERVLFVAERIEAWAERNPDQVVRDETLPKKQRGRPPKNYVKLSEIDGYVSDRMGFVRETIEHTGLSERTVQRLVATMAGLGKDLIFQLRASPKIAGNNSILSALAGISDKAEQKATVKALVEGRARSVPGALALATGKPVSKPKPDPVKKAEKLWRSMSEAEKARLNTFLSSQRQPKGWTGPVCTEAGDGEA